MSAHSMPLYSRFVLKKYLVFPIALLGLLAAPSYAETIDGAVQKSLQTHPTVESALSALDEAQQQRKIERSNYYPRISVGATGGRIFGDNATSRGLSVTRGEAYSYLSEGNIAAHQMIFDGFATKNRLDSASARRLSAVQALQETQGNLVFNTVRSYVDLLRVNKALLLIEGQAEKVEDYLSRIEQGVADGVMDEAELQQARDIKASMQGVLTQYKGQKYAAEAEYLELVGHVVTTEMENPMPNASEVIEEVEAAVEYALNNHPSIVSSRMTMKSAQYDVEAERASLYPTLDGELSYLRSVKDEDIGGPVTDARAVVRMNWDFETGLGQYARINQQKSTLKGARADLDTIRKQVERGVRLAYAEYKTSIDLLENQTQRAELNENLYEAYEVQFEAALVRILNLMQSDNQYFLARLDQLNTAHRALIAQYAILSSTGRLVGSFAQADADVR